MISYLRARNLQELRGMFAKGYKLQARFKDGAIKYVHQIAWDTVQIVDDYENPSTSEYVTFENPRIEAWEIATQVDNQPRAAGEVHQSPPEGSGADSGAIG